MGVGAGGENYVVRVTGTYVDRLSGPMARAASTVDTYTASLERLIATQARAGVGGGLTVAGATVATGTPAAAGLAGVFPAAGARGPSPAASTLHPAAAAAAAATTPGAVGVGGPGRSRPGGPTVAGGAPPPGAVTVGAMAPPAAAATTAGAAGTGGRGGGGGGMGGPGRTPGIVPGAGGGAGGGGRGGSQNVRINYLISGLRDVEAVNGAFTGILQSVTSIRTMLPVAILAGVTQLAIQAERTQRAFEGVAGSMQVGAQMAQQVTGVGMNAAIPLGASRGIATQLAQVAGGQFQAQTGAELRGITNIGTLRGLSEAQQQQIGAVFANAQSLQSGRRLRFQDVAALQDMGISNVWETLAQTPSARNAGYNALSLRQAMMYGGVSLPGAEATRQLTGAWTNQAMQDDLQRYIKEHPGVQIQQAQNRFQTQQESLGTHVGRALTPALSAYNRTDAQGNWSPDWGGVLGGLAPWNMYQADPGGAGALAIGLAGASVAASIPLVALRGMFRNQRTVNRLARSLGQPPGGGFMGGGGAGPGGGFGGRGGGGGVNPLRAAAIQGGVNPTAAAQYQRTVQRMVNQGATFELAHASAVRQTSIAFGPDVAAQLESSAVPNAAARQAAANRYGNLTQRTARGGEGAVNVMMERQFGPSWQNMQAPQAAAEEAAARPGVLDRVRARFGRGGPGRPPGGGGAPGAGVGAAAAESETAAATVAREAAVAREVGVAGREAGVLSRVSRGVGRAMPLLGLGIGLFGAYQAAQAGQNREAATQVGGAVGGLAGAEGGAILGAGLGTMVFPGVGTVVGGIAGGLLGGFGGGWLGEQGGGALGGMLGMRDQAQTANELAQGQQAQHRATTPLTDVTEQLTSDFVRLDQVIQQLVRDYNLQRARNGGGAGGGQPPGGGSNWGGIGPSAAAAGVGTAVRPMAPGEMPPTGDVAAWRGWVQQYIPDDLKNDPNFVNTVLAGAQAESGLDPRKVQPNGGGRGLFQFDLGGMGKGVPQSQLFDPDYQAQRIVPLYAQYWKQAPAGLSPAEKASWVAAQAERPLDYNDPKSVARRNYASAYSAVAGGDVNLPVGAAVSPATAPAPISPDIGQGNAVMPAPAASIQTGDINITGTMPGPGASEAELHAWAEKGVDALLGAAADRLSASDASTPSRLVPAAPVAFGG